MQAEPQGNVLDAEELSKAYATRFQAKEAYRLEVWRILIDGFFKRFIPQDATILDLGCGFGEFINQVGAKQKYGMDLNPDTRGKLDPSVTFLNQDCSAEWPVPAGSLDLVFTSNFFEHLPDKELLGRTLTQVHRCLKPGGKLVCLGPNIKYLPGTYWDFWDHYLPLTETSLSEGLRLKGFQVPLSIGRFLPYSMSTGFEPPTLFLKLYLKLPFAWRYFGKQFLVVGEK